MWTARTRSPRTRDWSRAWCTARAPRTCATSWPTEKSSSRAPACVPPSGRRFTVKRTPALVACAALSVCSAGVARGQEPPRVLPIYLVPRDSGFPSQGVAYHARALEDVRQWYGRVLGGRTFVYEPLVVQVSRHTFAELAADSFQAWWPLLQQEFADYGWPWNRHAKVKLLFLTHHAGAWAGSRSEERRVGKECRSRW